jgi:hypothetical protein
MPPYEPLAHEEGLVSVLGDGQVVFEAALVA